VANSNGRAVRRCADEGEPGALAAETAFELLSSSDDGRFCLVVARPKHGRTHQIRLHLLHSGMPIAGDEIYGAVDDEASRLCLHAAALELTHPSTGARVRIESAAPADFVAELERVRVPLPRAALAFRDGLRETSGGGGSDRPSKPGQRRLPDWAAP